MFCSNCGKETGEGKYCAHCGYKNLEHLKSSKVQKFYVWSFTIVNNQKLETRAWFRFLRVLHILLFVGICLSTVLIGYLVFDNKTTTSSTLVCNDGTRWDALNNSKFSWSSADQCGLCTKRNSDNTYQECSYSDSGIYNSYKVENEYKRTTNPFHYFLLPLIGLVVALAIVKVIVRGLVYIFGGKNN